MSLLSSSAARLPPRGEAGASVLGDGRRVHTVGGGLPSRLRARLHCDDGACDGRLSASYSKAKSPRAAWAWPLNQSCLTVPPPPELPARQENILGLVQEALATAGVKPEELDCLCYTKARSH